MKVVDADIEALKSTLYGIEKEINTDSKNVVSVKRVDAEALSFDNKKYLLPVNDAPLLDKKPIKFADDFKSIIESQVQNKPYDIVADRVSLDLIRDSFPVVVDGLFEMKNIMLINPPTAFIESIHKFHRVRNVRLVYPNKHILNAAVEDL